MASLSTSLKTRLAACFQWIGTWALMIELHMLRCAARKLESRWILMACSDSAACDVWIYPTGAEHSSVKEAFIVYWFSKPVEWYCYAESAKYRETSVSGTIRKPPLIDFARLLHPSVCMWLWNHDSEFTKWQHPAMWYVALGWHAIEFARTSAILEFYVCFRFWPYHCSQHAVLHKSAKFYLNLTTLCRKKWRHVDFQDGGSQPSCISGVQ